MKHLTTVFSVLLLLLLVIAIPVSGSTVIVHTNDVHGYLDEDIGYDGLAAYVNDLQAKGNTVLLLDAGDAFQGTTITNYYKGEPVVELMNAVGYQAMVPGNHDFDFGWNQLLNLTNRLQFPALALNIRDSATEKPLFKSSTIVETPDAKIGIIGISTPNTKTTSLPSNTEGVTFLEGEELYTCAQNEVNDLKEKGCTFIICLAHLGLDQVSYPYRSSDLAAKVSGIDLIIDGHSHTVLPEGQQANSSLIVSTGSYFENIGVVQIIDGTPTASLISSSNYTKKDETISALIKSYTDEFNILADMTIAKTPVTLDGEREHVRSQETNLGNLVTDALFWTGKENGIYGDFCLLNGGSIRASIPAGNISENDLLTVFPFLNTLASAEVTGQQMLTIIEANTATTPELEGGFPQVSNLIYTVDTTKPYVDGEINRVSISSVQGKPFDINKTYTMITNDFIAAGGDKYQTIAGNKFVDFGITVTSAVVEYLNTVCNGVVSQEYYAPQGRITVLGTTENTTSAGTTSQSPYPIAGIIAGIGALAVFLRRH